MKLALVQLNSKLGDAEANRRKVETAIRQAAKHDVDIVALPETWNLGFFPREHLDRLAEPDGGASRQLLADLAEELAVNIVGGSLITKKQGGIYNTAYIFDRDGLPVAEYDKIHGFSPAGEDQHFRHGSTPCTFSLDGVKMGLLTCYDLRFCELSRLLALDGAQMLFVPAQWPAVRLEHWQVLAHARAIENQFFVAAVNGCGEAYGAAYAGHSMLLSPYGELLAGAGGSETTLYCEVDPSRVAEIRERMDVFRDRKPEVYDRFARERGLSQ